MPYIVVDENGEIIEGRVAILNEGDRVVRRRSLEFLKGKEKRKPIHVGEYINILADNFVMCHLDELKLISEALDMYEKGMLMTVMPYVGYEDCCIKKGDGTPLNVNDFTKLTGLSKSKVYKIVASLIEKNILYKDKKGYFVNPWLFYKGTKLNKDLIYMFGEYEIRCKDMMKWIDLLRY